jgi:polyisoprenyl-teichoic acid--peptidoglycan teichoic acid transferase
MSRDTKPYRRFRVRGGEPSADGGDGLDALRALTAREAGVATPDAPPPGPAGPGRPPEPPRRRRPDPLERERRRDLARQGRHWYSLKGLGPGGWIGRAVVLMLVLVTAWGVFGWFALNSAVGDANGKITKSAYAALDDPSGGMLGTPENTLILGVDARKGRTRSRADTILIMRTDPDSGRIKYLSIPRDWRVDLPVYGTQKINSAFFFFGQAGMIRAVKRVTGLPIHHIMVIKFNGFPKMIDSLGGITVSNPTAITDCPYEAGQRVSFPAGQIHLDGTRALVFSRVRKCDSDFARALRQQAVVAGMKKKVLSFSNLWRAPWNGAAVVRTLQTDIGTMDMVKMGWLQARLAQKKGDRILLTGTPENIGGIDYVVQTDPDLNEREIAKFVAKN